jgi:hypothetical protein
MVSSHSFKHEDLRTDWYVRWANELKQDSPKHLDGNMPGSNKFWQNAVVVQALFERGMLKEGKKAIGFGVGTERLPALFAKYRVFVTATDQDFTTQKAGHWAAKELATSAQSLNNLGICDPKLFVNQVEYAPVDMNKVPAKYDGKYDIVWSNCALGHLGSIPAGLDFIKRTLDCLRPGGWAVHTTELNILSNDETVTGGTTVIFRLKDIYELQKRLVENGYEVEPFMLTLGNAEKDKRVSMMPLFGNDSSKIQVMGHLATQIVLIIHKPTAAERRKFVELKAIAKLSMHYQRSLKVVRRYRKSDPTIASILQSQKRGPEEIQLTPKEAEIKVTVKHGDEAEVFVAYKNTTKFPLFSLYARLANNHPIVLATDHPRDRASQFANEKWEGANSNRTSSALWVKNGKEYGLADYILPGQDFAFKVAIDAGKAAKGTHEEHFSVVQEYKGWINNSTAKIVVTVV